MGWRHETQKRGSISGLVFVARWAHLQGVQVKFRPFSTNHDPHQIQVSLLVPFLLITFALAWGILGLFIFLPDQMTRLFGELTGQHPLFFLAVWSPAIAARIVVTNKAGLGGLTRYLSRLLLWRTPSLWILFLLVGVPLLFIGGSVLKGNFFSDPFPFATLASFFAALAFTAIKGPIEEIGWRGLALPLLQRCLAPFWACLVLGVIWGLWHLPAFLLSGTPQSAWSFTPFFAGSIAISVIITALFNASRGSILLPAVFHFQANNPLWPDAQPFDTLFFVAAAVVAVWFHRTSMFSTESGVTEVIPQVGVHALIGRRGGAKEPGP
jgi:uncharacterized protein